MTADENKSSAKFNNPHKNIEIELKELEPKNSSNFKHHVISGLVVILLIALIFIGIIGGFKKIFSTININSTIDQYNLRLLSATNQKFLIIDQQGDNAEIKLINNKTGEILDISSGDKKASHAAISPKEDMIAYVKTDRSGSELYLIAMPNYLIKVFDKNNLNNQARSLFDHDVCKICNWSKLYWSPDGGKIAFFVCSQKNTALFFVTAKANEVPKVIQNTVNGFNHPRDAAWLNDSTLIFTSTETKDNYLYKIEPAKQDHPERIYGAIR